MNAEDIQTKVIEVVDTVSKSVVQINSRKIKAYRNTLPLRTESTASGIILSTSGYVLTNNHVIDESQETEVIAPDGTILNAEIIGADSLTDLALLKTKANGMSPVKFADSDNLKAGQFAIAVGNALGLPGAPTVSLGVVSAIGRPMPWSDFIFEGLIQTDAAINPGNSGGPLADLSGNVIGINTAMIPFAQGVGFAIPSNTVNRVVEQILTSGRVVRPWLGISGIAVTDEISQRLKLPTKNGVMILRMTRGGPAHKSGLELYDTIVSINGMKVDSMRTLLSTLANIEIGETAEFTVIRKNKIVSAKIQMEEMPELYIENGNN
ncbi:MAG: trypsin-like peptidase domain-containing protein [Thermoplasmatales archaeon]|nr:trypsin-like peptidase domain-containing protein [Thermoplasmatales archaeon]MCW6169661.1 trypsin-like peptidase domain-containing protein [Thermoplasmatales archaeon]